MSFIYYCTKRLWDTVVDSASFLFKIGVITSCAALLICVFSGVKVFEFAGKVDYVFSGNYLTKNMYSR